MGEKYGNTGYRMHSCHRRQSLSQSVIMQSVHYPIHDQVGLLFALANLPPPAQPSGPLSVFRPLLPGMNVRTVVHSG